LFARTALVGGLALLASAPAAPAAQVLQLDLASAQNATPRGIAAQSAPLQRRTKYVVTISGTGSLWTPDASAPVTCGAPEPGATITQPSPGRAATAPTVDAAIVFAAPRGVPFLGGFACVQPTPKQPPAQAALRMGTGGPLRAATPIGGTPRRAAPDHTYHYAVKGRGRPLQLQYADPLVYDNTGILTVTVRTEAECRAVRCTSTSGAPAPKVTTSFVAPAALPCAFSGLPSRAGRSAEHGLCA
jgi:hypothetical protein